MQQIDLYLLQIRYMYYGVCEIEKVSFEKTAEKAIKCTRKFLIRCASTQWFGNRVCKMPPLNAHFDLSCIGRDCFQLHPYFVYEICKKSDESVNLSRYA